MSAAADPVVLASALAKSYGDFRAVDGVDFRIERGECFGFLGPNGAGKTTTMRMVQAVSLPSSGQISVLGLDPTCDGKKIRARIGVCPQSDNLDPDLRVRQNLLIYAGYFPMSQALTVKKADELLEFVALSEKRERP